jgi:hypothetical protein
MDDFSKYEQIKSQGASPRDVYRIAHADGVDSITMIRMLRKIFGLSLREAKAATGAGEELSAMQEVKVGSTVSWECWMPDGSVYFMEGVVERVDGDSALVSQKHRFKSADCGVEEVSVEPPSHVSIACLERTLAERIGELIENWDKNTSSTVGVRSDVEEMLGARNQNGPVLGKESTIQQVKEEGRRF